MFNAFDDTQAVLHIGDRRYLMNREEAMLIAEALCSSSRIASDYHNRKSLFVVAKPDFGSAFVSPMTAIFTMELQANAKELEEKNK